MREKLPAALVPFLVLTGTTGCGDDKNTSPTPTLTPRITAVSAQANIHNNLSAVISFRSVGSDSARALYWPRGLGRSRYGASGTVAPAADEGADGVSATPFYAVSDGDNRITTLGLAPETEYWHVIEGKGPAGGATSGPVRHRTGPLPEFLADLRITRTGRATPGYLLATLPGYVTVLDRNGRVCWYRHWDGYVGRDAGQEENGNFSAFIGTTVGSNPTFGYFVEFEPGGKEVSRHIAPAPFYTDSHELILTDDGPGPSTAHLFSYDIRRTDLRLYGGAPDAPVAGHQILRTQGPVVEFMWNAWDHFSIEDVLFDRPGFLGICDGCDFDHPNSLDIDHDGHYIASFAAMSEITKINSRTGDLIWRLGGANNQFTILNDPENGFSGQHFARILDNGNLLLYDNGQTHDPKESRAVEYVLDTRNMTATRVWEYRHHPPLYTAIVGSVQRLQSGNTLVGFTGNYDFQSTTGPATVVEVDPSGNLVWEVKFDDMSIIYRVVKIASLYKYREP